MQEKEEKGKERMKERKKEQGHTMFKVSLLHTKKLCWYLSMLNFFAANSKLVSEELCFLFVMFSP